MKELFSDHIKHLRKRYAEAMQGASYDAVLIHSGTPFTYFADDQDAPFRSTPAFAHWLPLRGAHHLLLVTPNRKPLLIMVTPEDFWFDHEREENPFWAGEFDIREVPTMEEAWKLASKEQDGVKSAFVGDAIELAKEYDLDINPQPIIEKLNEIRTIKTPYEISCMEEANRRASLGHKKAREAFLSGASELELHHAFLAGAQTVDSLLPYSAITALDSKSAVLHYEGKRYYRNGNPKEQSSYDGKVCLVDAGVKVRGYDSDITRTWTAPTCDPRFVSLVKALDKLQQELCALVRPNLHTIDLHKSAHLGIAKILREHGITTANAEEAIDEKITATFFPHGLGHFLGIQTHDVGGPDKDAENHPERSRFPRLRTARRLVEGNVITIEPGIYFIPILLAKLKASPASKLVNWDLINELTSCGGIRIEDDVLVTKEGQRNLTRPFLA